MPQSIKNLLSSEAASGVILILAAILALIVANSPLASVYESLQTTSFSFWVNDGLMAIFFLLIGIELKQELKEGQLSTKAQAFLPFAAALGGVLVPSIIYTFLNWGTPAMRGWAIPSATDIAFSLGLLALFGKKIPPPLRIFLMAVAVIDDLAAVLIIALFYTEKLSYMALLLVVIILLLTYAFCPFRTKPLWGYIGAGIILWVATLQSGVHPTVAGVVLGLMIPLPLGHVVMHRLHPWVAFGIIPLFAFANAGISLAGLTMEKITHSIPLGIALGLFIGKQTGIFMTSWVLVRTGLARLPASVNWLQFYAICVIAGIGFTMSLFIGSLAFSDYQSQTYIRLGVIIGSLASALFGAMILAYATRSPAGTL